MRRVRARRAPRSTSASWERVAEVVEGGLAFWPELPPQASSQCAGPDVAGQADALTRPWRSVGLPMAGLRDVVLLAGDITGKGSPDDARAVLAGLVRAARIVAERAEALTSGAAQPSVGRALALLVGVRRGDRRDGAARRLLHRHRRDAP